MANKPYNNFHIKYFWVKFYCVDHVHKPTDPTTPAELESQATWTYPELQINLVLSLHQLPLKMAICYEIRFWNIPVLWKHNKCIYMYPTFKLVVLSEVPQSLTADRTFCSSPHRILSWGTSLSPCPFHKAFHWSPNEGEQAPQNSYSRCPLQLHRGGAGKDQCILLFFDIQGWKKTKESKGWGHGAGITVYSLWSEQVWDRLLLINSH